VGLPPRRRRIPEESRMLDALTIFLLRKKK